MNPLYAMVAERAGHRCEYCRAPEEVFNFTFEVEHIQPQSLRGTNDGNNLALSCESCNLFKSDATTGWDDLTLQTSPLFHPRQNVWTEHFLFAPETASVHGQTPSGRATVERLRLNSAFQVRARQHWVRLGLYP